MSPPNGSIAATTAIATEKESGAGSPPRTFPADGYGFAGSRSTLLSAFAAAEPVAIATVPAASSSTTSPASDNRPVPAPAPLSSSSMTEYGKSFAGMGPGGDQPL